MLFSWNLQGTLVLIVWLISISTIHVCVDGAAADEQEETISSSSDDDDDSDLQNTVYSMIQWVINHGGYVSPKIELRAFSVEIDGFDSPSSDDDDDDNDEKYSFGVFIKSDERVKEGERLLDLPDDVMIYSDVKAVTVLDNMCLLADEVLLERNLNAEGKSEYGPYLDFFEKFVVGQINLPATWSQTGRYILGNITQATYFTTFRHYYGCFLQGESGEEIQRILNESGLEGFGDPDFWDENLEIALSRGRHDDLLVPLYDMIQHSNDPRKMNIVRKKSGSPNDHSFSVFASRDMGPSEELRYSYGLGSPQENHWLGFVDYGLGTMEMFRTHGFVEPYPQRWFFPEHALDFMIHQDGPDDDGTEAYQPKLRVQWLSDTIPDDDALYTLRVNYDGLFDIRNQMIDAYNSPKTNHNLLAHLTPHEISISFEFLLSYIAALDTALKAADAMNQRTGSEYIVTEEKVAIENMDHLYFQLYQCSTMITKILNHEFNAIDELQSAYQQINYYKDPKTNDRCLYLDSVYQQCISYWPHYHELVVHKSAKYLKEDLRRVLWVGGGDSGVLNEFLKYPTLELAVGLELDQQVTRSAFKHFASRPHYDDPRVQWWYGDASESLLMLPEHYFGSFDLVIVDLSDTVFSLSVSAELDVIEAISLLLRPGGIFEMNELFMKKVSKVFEYTVHYNFNDVPRILDQSAIFASNDVDFMSRELTEHELVEDATILVEKDSMLTKHRFDRIHDYRHNPNPAFKKLCKVTQEEEEEKPSEDQPQSAAPGIMMIVEAESLTADLSSLPAVRISVIKAIEGVGLTVVSEKESPLESPWFVIVMKEGYVVVRLWVEKKYCALDLHLWSSFDSHEGLKKAIVADALGGDLMNKSTSSYRIVAGGMFGLSNWKEEAKKHGPQIDNLCSEKEAPVLDQPSSADVYELALETSLDIIQGKELTVAVMCNVTSEPCQSLETLYDHRLVNHIIPLHPCTVDDVKFDGWTGNKEEYLDECTMQRVQQILQQELKENEFVDMLILDPGCSEEFSDSLRYLNNGTYINFDDIFVVGTVDSKNDVWKRKLVDYFRFGLAQVDPVHRAHLLFNSTSQKSSLELVMGVVGDPLFFEHMVDAVKRAHEIDGEDDPTADVTIEIRNVFGGYWRDDKIDDCDLVEFSQVTKAEDYDTTDAKSQWASQRPAGTQSVARFVNQDQLDPQVLLPLEDPQKLINVVRNALAPKGAIFEAFQFKSINGGDGVVCTGSWGQGTAVISWDGRSQVDINLWISNKSTMMENDEETCSSPDASPESVTDQELKDIKMLEVLIVANTASTLKPSLRDVQPRGYGRIINSQKDLDSVDTFFNQHDR
ncbi:unnamed protein product [Cylindrotheca closterium]|uniref:Uncharacterized protein n=1 Tax=Cylindrotheca closterium TaxID=2856 RepID=A0AAD2CE14_9STRA|nr:unnamed protein product [Cylindrotheca closterium]